jgi:uncharacterized repeat protein (TIGR01451 family)
MKQISWRWVGLLLVVLLALVSAAYAQGDDLDLIPGSSSVDNGGGTLSSGNLTLTGAIGQPDAGFPLRNGEFVLVGGTFASGSPEADPAMSKEANTLTPSQGQDVVYTVIVMNNGPNDATSVMVSDTLPGDVTYVSDDDGGGGRPYDESIGVWTVGDLDAQASATLRITVIVSDVAYGARITNTAVISESEPSDLDPDNNRAEVVITVAPPTPVGGHTELASAWAWLWPRMACLIATVGVGTVTVATALRKRRKQRDTN